MHTLIWWKGNAIEASFVHDVHLTADLYINRSKQVESLVDIYKIVNKVQIFNALKQNMKCTKLMSFKDIWYGR